MHDHGEINWETTVHNPVKNNLRQQMERVVNSYLYKNHT